MNFSLARVSGELGSSLSECSLFLLPLLLPVSQGWWCHFAGPHYWIRMITAWFFWAQSNFLCLCDGLTSSHVLFAGDGITGLLVNTVSLGHFPLSVFFVRLRQCVTPLASSWSPRFSRRWSAPGSWRIVGGTPKHQLAVPITAEKEHQTLFHDSKK